MSKAKAYCRKCGIAGEPIRRKWWHQLLPRCRRFYCAGCGKTYLRLFQ